MKRPYNPPKITEVRLDHTINLTGGCKKGAEKVGTGDRRCESNRCKLTGATS